MWVYVWWVVSVEERKKKRSAIFFEHKKHIKVLKNGRILVVSFHVAAGS